MTKKSWRFPCQNEQILENVDQRGDVTDITTVTGSGSQTEGLGIWKVKWAGVDGVDCDPSARKKVWGNAEPWDYHLSQHGYSQTVPILFWSLPGRQEMVVVLKVYYEAQSNKWHIIIKQIFLHWLHVSTQFIHCREFWHFFLIRINGGVFGWRRNRRKKMFDWIKTLISSFDYILWKMPGITNYGLRRIFVHKIFNCL